MGDALMAAARKAVPQPCFVLSTRKPRGFGA